MFLRVPDEGVDLTMAASADRDRIALAVFMRDTMVMNFIRYSAATKADNVIRPLCFSLTVP